MKLSKVIFLTSLISCVAKESKNSSANINTKVSINLAEDNDEDVLNSLKSMFYEEGPETEKLKKLSRKELQKLMLKESEKYESLQGQLQGRQTAIEHLFDELRANTSIGCHRDENIATLSILVNGKALAKRVVGVFDTQIKSQGDGSLFAITFGPDFNVNHNDASNGLFQPEGKLEFNNLSNHIVGDIKEIKIDKNFLEYDHTRLCKHDKGSLFSKSTVDCQFEIGEVRRYQLNSLILKVNGMEFYKETNINHTFERGEQTWVRYYSDLSLNETYVKFISDNSCAPEAGDL